MILLHLLTTRAALALADSECADFLNAFQSPDSDAAAAL